MAKHHILAVVAAFMLASALSGEQAVLGPEVPLLRDFSNQAIGGDAVAIAANGSDFLLVWQDSRGGAPAIRATRVGSTGRAANPLGTFIGNGTKPQVARAGSGYLIVWQKGDFQLWSARVDANGLPGATQLLIDHASDPVAQIGRASCRER